MWCYRLVAPYTFERVTVPEPAPDRLRDGQVLLKFLAAGICGSDIPGFKGVQGRLPGGTPGRWPPRWRASRSTRSSAK